MTCPEQIVRRAVAIVMRVGTGLLLVGLCGSFCLGLLETGRGTVPPVVVALTDSGWERQVGDGREQRGAAGDRRGPGLTDDGLVIPTGTAVVLARRTRARIVGLRVAYRAIGVSALVVRLDGAAVGCGPRRCDTSAEVRTGSGGTPPELRDGRPRGGASRRTGNAPVSSRLELEARGKTEGRLHAVIVTSVQTRSPSGRWREQVRRSRGPLGVPLSTIAALSGAGLLLILLLLAARAGGSSLGGAMVRAGAPLLVATVVWHLLPARMSLYAAVWGRLIGGTANPATQRGRLFLLLTALVAAVTVAWPVARSRNASLVPVIVSPLPPSHVSEFILPEVA